MAKTKTEDRVKECLAGVSYPASKSELIQHAQSKCNDEEVINMLKDLPEETTYGGEVELLDRVKNLLNVSVNL